MNAFAELPPTIQALIATLFTWGVTALGASLVFTAREVSRKALDFMLGFAGGVMLAASFWSLLAPAIAIADNPKWLPAVVGFLLGGVFLRIMDQVIPHLHLQAPLAEAEGVKTAWQRAILLVLAITLHNIPEGLAVGVAFGAATANHDAASLTAAIALAIGIGLQNFPEGVAVAVPLRREGLSPLKSFWYGQLSGAVEPVAGVIGALAVVVARPILPYALGFAAGAMIYVVVEEVIPESHRGGNADLATTACMLGFATMMLLDVALS
jgi:zinc transporter, ZIP family